MLTQISREELARYADEDEPAYYSWQSVASMWLRVPELRAYVEGLISEDELWELTLFRLAVDLRDFF